MILIKNLRTIRENKGISQLQCSIDTQIPLRTIQRYESGKNIGDPEYLCRLMKYYDLTLNDLIDSNEDKKR